jgi:hypothetical protein
MRAAPRAFVFRPGTRAPTSSDGVAEFIGAAGSDGDAPYGNRNVARVNRYAVDALFYDGME